MSQYRISNEEFRQARSAAYQIEAAGSATTDVLIDHGLEFIPAASVYLKFNGYLWPIFSTVFSTIPSDFGGIRGGWTLNETQLSISIANDNATSQNVIICYTVYGEKADA